VEFPQKKRGGASTTLPRKETILRGVAIVGSG
jgi:hypothetical protein